MYQNYSLALALKLPGRDGTTLHVVAAILRMPHDSS